MKDAHSGGARLSFYIESGKVLTLTHFGSLQDLLEAFLLATILIKPKQSQDACQTSWQEPHPTNQVFCWKP